MLTTSASGTSSSVAIFFQVLRRQVAFLHCLQLALELAQVEEQLLLRRRRAHFDQRPGVQDVFLDRRADPPHGIGREAKAAVGSKRLTACIMPTLPSEISSDRGRP
jgi:hypothetical protein